MHGVEPIVISFFMIFVARTVQGASKGVPEIGIARIFHGFEQCQWTFMVMRALDWAAEFSLTGELGVFVYCTNVKGYKCIDHFEGGTRWITATYSSVNEWFETIVLKRFIVFSSYPAYQQIGIK